MMTFRLLLLLAFAAPPAREVAPVPVAAFPTIPVTDTTYGPVGGVVPVPGETYSIAAPVRVSSVAGVKLQGDGPLTGLVYMGPVGGSCLELTGTQRATVERMWLRSRLDWVTNAPTAEAGIVLTKRPGDVYAQTAANVRDVWFGSHNNLADFKHCVLVDSKKYGQPDANNDLHEFTRVRFRGYSESAVKVAVSSTQAMAFKFVDCEMDGHHRAKYGVEWNAKPFFSWVGGSGGYHTESDFYLGDSGASVVIDRWNSEWSARLLTTAGPTGANGSIVIRDTRADALSARDGRFIIGKMPGPWTITGGYFAVGPGNSAELIVDLSNINVKAVVTCTGNVFVHGRKPTGPVVRAPAGSRLTVKGNVHLWPGGSFID